MTNGCPLRSILGLRLCVFSSQEAPSHGHLGDSWHRCCKAGDRERKLCQEKQVSERVTCQHGDSRPPHIHTHSPGRCQEAAESTAAGGSTWAASPGAPGVARGKQELVDVCNVSMQSSQPRAAWCSLTTHCADTGTRPTRGPLSRRTGGGAKPTPEVEELLNKKHSEETQKKYAERKENAAVSSLLEELFQLRQPLAWAIARPGQSAHQQVAERRRARSPSSI